MDPVTLSAIIGGGTSILGGALGNSSANKAARAQERAGRLAYEAAMAGIDEQRRQYDTTRSDFAGYRDAGNTSLAALLSGNQSGEFSPEYSFDFDANTDPGAKYRQDRAMKAIEASAAARGGGLSTGTLRSLMQESQNMASQEYGAAEGRASADYARRYGAASDKANRYQNIANMGLSATGQGAQMGQMAATNTGNLLMSGANALGAGMTGAADTRAAGSNALWSGVSGAVNQGLGAYLQNAWRNPGVSPGTSAGYDALRQLGVR